MLIVELVKRYKRRKCPYSRSRQPKKYHRWYYRTVTKPKGRRKK